MSCSQLDMFGSSVTTLVILVCFSGWTCMFLSATKNKKYEYHTISIIIKVETNVQCLSPVFIHTYHVELKFQDKESNTNRKNSRHNHRYQY